MDKELKPIYDTAKSFYKKAYTYEEDGAVYLVSYNTGVACIQNGEAQVIDTYSKTTLRHIKEFLKQAGFKAESKKQILTDYKPKEILDKHHRI